MSSLNRKALKFGSSTYSNPPLGAIHRFSDGSHDAGGFGMVGDVEVDFILGPLQRLGEEATREVVVRSALANPRNKGLGRKPRLSVQPHVGR